MLRIHNTLAREKQDFVPLRPGAVGMYVCGITVYDYCHLGHGRMMVVFDMVRRWLLASGLDVTYVRNITDIDDKIIRRAVENGETIGELTGRFIRAMDEDLERLGDEVIACELCPRLVAHCREVARVRVRRHRDDEYWGRPVPAFGDPRARLLVLGLAPAAHGANRTGRMFTGDSSGDWLYRALHRAGFADRPRSASRDDGLVLRGAWVTAAAHCAPPDNRPTPEELGCCRPFLERELGDVNPEVLLVCTIADWRGRGFDDTREAREMFIEGFSAVFHEAMKRT